ncbi:16S rRNA (guanine(527)-N(7))-methyltransferase RsmG [Tautonia plasticadhaerens]|uniref:Ribosomal RNA small subunit methyltransferase G n=1 Tax=Tautonia plasticadhaerens TaxID=2527974 RepID=A0A518GVX1_9BACT|nr:16S rRNA (guanine(527)-N(7))-methyltransferase RsmG [Tautonia plasticadhaerens]QDV32744.1 Ribosomal RNA small subunit methyltransferase G [Tautonia plasticadhaerens]
MSSTPNRAALKGILERCGLRLSEGQYDLLWSYHRLLREADAELNLTRIRNFENMVLKHYVDSLLVLKHVELPSPLVDMGSGAGLPGIPLKIARPGVHMILAEPRGARAAFLRAACERLGLDGAEVHEGKVGPHFTRPVEGVISRAVATIPETLGRVAYCLRPGGRMIFLKGPDCDPEVAEARQALGEAYRLSGDFADRIPGTEHRRRFVVFERLDAPVVSASMPEATPPLERAFSGPAKEVTSASNPSFRLAREVLNGRGIRKHGRALISGRRILSEVVDRFADRVESWLTGPGGDPPPEGLDPGVTWLRLDASLFRELDVSGTKGPLLLARVPEMPTWSEADPWPDGCTLFVPFQDPENVGAVLRSAAAFGVSRVVLLREAAHPFHPKAVRAAGPAVFQVPILSGPSIDELSLGSVPMVPLDVDGPAIDLDPWPDRFGLVPGVEGPGLPGHLRGHPGRRRVPIAAGVESLNAATACAVALFSWRSGAGRPSGSLG